MAFAFELGALKIKVISFDFTPSIEAHTTALPGTLLLMLIFPPSPTSEAKRKYGSSSLTFSVKRPKS